MASRVVHHLWAGIERNNGPGDSQGCWEVVLKAIWEVPMLVVEERPWLQSQHYSSWFPRLHSIPSYQMSAIIHQIVSQLLNVHHPPHQSKTQNEQI